MVDATLTNASELLLHHSEELAPPTLLLGAPRDGLADRLAGPCHSVTTHFGQWRGQGGHDRHWYFGYDDPGMPAEVGTVVIFMPKARAELALRLALAESVVAEGGRIALIGAKKEGIAGGARQLRERFSRSWKGDSGRHCQLWWAQGVEAGCPFRVKDYMGCHEAQIAGQQLRFHGLPGLFSEGRVDAGTRMLLESLQETPPQDGGSMLDFACGSGIVGAWLSQMAPSRALTLSDVQWQAVACTRELFAGQEAASVLPSDGLAGIRDRFGLVITNPPFHEGVRTDQSVTLRFLSEVGERLLPGGELRLVANRFLPYAEAMEKALGRPQVLAEDGRFRVWQVFRKR